MKKIAANDIYMIDTDFIPTDDYIPIYTDCTDYTHTDFRCWVTYLYLTYDLNYHKLSARMPSQGI